LVYRSIVNPKPSLAALGAIENLNTLLPFYALGLIAHSVVLSAIVNLKSSVKDVGIGIKVLSLAFKVKGPILAIRGMDSP